MPRHYLDHASTSPCRPEALEAMLPWLHGGAETAGDPGRVHTEGRMARAAIEHAREQVAALVGARPGEVVFTSGATEAVNAATWGAVAHAEGPVLAPAVEHSSVLDAARRHDRLIEIAVDGTGRIDIDALREELARSRSGSPSPSLVHVQWANHEVGTLQPTDEVVGLARDAGVLVHCDAAAAAGHVAVSFAETAVDLMSLSSHKLGGPRGAGALVVRRGLRLEPLIVGGEQERARRGGMENVPALVGFGAACQAAADALGSEQRVATAQAEALVRSALAVDGVVFYGDPDASRRLPHIVCVGVDGVEAEAVLLGLDQSGIAAHSGSACSSESLEPSPVLAAMGVEAERSLRLSVGWSTTDADVDAFASAFPTVVARLRALGA